MSLEVTTTTEAERRLLFDFNCLNERAGKYFQFLRDLPIYCDDNIWEKYFGQTFDAYNRTWKFQRKYRSLLEKKYDLKRWQIGEIASKIGQLYYSYYTRTSDVTYLMETFAFYSAIRSRGYYSTASKEIKGDVMIKQLRYYARFIMTCILLKKFKLTRELIKELNGEVDEFVHIYGSNEDELEWTVVINEALDFANADSCLSVVDMDTVTVVLSHRMSVFNCISSSDWNINGQLWLNQVIIIGSKLNQAKFSELTIDMYRMLQTLEREIPQETIKLMSQDSTSSSSPILFDQIKRDNGELKENPQKILLYKPTIETVFLRLSLSMKKQTMNSVVLLYLSADGVPDLNCNDEGGLFINLRKKSISLDVGASNEYTAMVENRAFCVIRPDDVRPYLRTPYFLIVESDNSSSFLALSSPFNQPVVILCSPVETPPHLKSLQRNGSLFTLFLHSPLTAFCVISKIDHISLAIWDKCQVLIDGFSQEVTRLIASSSVIDLWYKTYVQDDFLRILICRFVFCSFVLRSHRKFQDNPSFLPSCQPPINFDLIMGSPFLADFVAQLANILSIVDWLS